MKTIRLYLVFLLIIFSLCINLHSQDRNYFENRFVQSLDRKLTKSEIFHSTVSGKRIGHYSKEDWKSLIDSVWGQGLSTTEKLQIFDNAWNTVNTTYAAFQNLDVDIDSFKNVYRPEIENGVSRGRFAAIMNYFALSLNEAHTIIADNAVNYGTYPSPGIPLFVIGPWQDNSRFGAALTPLPDSSLLVYRSRANQRLGLIPGDIVLGYDGIPWKSLYKELIEAQLPILVNGVWGSTEESLSHCILASVGLNWHLFDTIDIIKSNTGDTLHLSTSPLQSQSGFIWGNEQYPVPGVDFPNVQVNDFVSWGVIDGTQIGYIYVLSWSSNSQYQISTQFYNAIDSLMNVYNTKGLVVDFRNNNGGWMPIAHAGYSLLFNQQIPTVAFDIRSGSTNHFSMVPHPTYTSAIFTIPGNPSTYYDKPIAILTGPGSLSNGDFESYRLRLHPRARLFGKSSCGAFATSFQPPLAANWFFLLTSGNGYPVSSPGQYLTHTKLNIDEPVWLSKNGVMNGKDEVVEKAVEWINETVSINVISTTNAGYYLSNNYPNPFNPSTKFIFSIPLKGFVRISIKDILGREVSQSVNGSFNPGTYEVKYDGSSLPSGIYFYTIVTGIYKETKKMLLVK